MFGNAFQDKTVWLSGHTGFKGAWLAQWLILLGAKVHGFAQPPATNPALFEQLSIGKNVIHSIGDIRDESQVRKSILKTQPDFVFHLAAQSLVRASYSKPLETHETNVLGTAHVLEALRALDRPCVGIFVTSDKCYENREWVHSYREEDALGGHDPYSASKAAAEIIIGSYRRSFFSEGAVKIASVRAGNVIGGGDWAADRIVPDCIRALSSSKPIPVRNRTSIRPWQHVLEPLSGYLWLAAALSGQGLVKFDLAKIPPAFNFGPNSASGRTVEDLVHEILLHWPGSWEDHSNPNAPHEATSLRLSIDKAHMILGWSPVWDFAETVAQTVRWYRSVSEGADVASAKKLSIEQINHYTQEAKRLSLSWAMD